MLKHYCVWQFKKWWPMLIIISIIVFITGLFSALSGTLTVRADPSRHSNVYGSGGLIILAMFAPALFASFAMPLFVFGYRTKRQSVDTYYQAAYAPTTIKRARFFIGLAILLVAFVIGYFLTVAVFALRYYGVPETQVISEVVYERMPINFDWYFIAFAVLFIVLAVQYSINCFLVSLGDYVFDQVCLLIFGTLFLNLFITAPVLYLMALSKNSSLADYLIYGIGPVAPIAMCVTIFQSFVFGVDISGLGTFPTHVIVATIVGMVLGASSFVGNIMLPDPSGEYADTKGARNNTVALIPHGAALCFGFLQASLNGTGIVAGSYYAPLTLLALLSVVLYAVIYYCALALWRHTFKISKTDLIFFLSVTGTVLIFDIIARIMR